MSMMDRPPAWRYWYGRKLFLAEKQSFYRCGGFAVSRVNPVSFVSEDTQVNKIIEAVEAGILIDITDSDKGLVIGGIGHSRAKVENTGKKVYITTDKDGGLAIKSAETPEEIEACEAQIKKTGIIVPQDYKFADPFDTAGRVQGADVALVLHNLEEKVENANQKVFGNLPKVIPGPHKVS